MSNTFDETVLDTFLEKQLQLFPAPVAITREEADAFLEDCFATVCKDAAEAVACLDETMDITGLSREEILSAEEVFSLPDGRYLIVEG